jgi:hypothetical protein
VASGAGTAGGQDRGQDVGQRWAVAVGGRFGNCGQGGRELRLDQGCKKTGGIAAPGVVVLALT